MTSRRTFVAALTSVAGLGLAAQPPTPTRRVSGAWDMSWLDRFAGAHKQLFDAATFDLSVDTPLRVPMNYLDGLRDVYGVEPPAVNVAIGVSRLAFPLNASDGLWRKYELGQRWGITDPSTSKPAVRNVFLGDASGGDPATVRALQARGALFWQCNFALGAVAFTLARAFNAPLDATRADLIAGLNPGVVLVATHAMAVGVVQQRGFTYMKL